MKQALTAKGLLSVWFGSAKSALEKMGVDYQVKEEGPSLSGNHPQLGPIQIDFKVPEEGKTRMEITVADPSLIAQFKTAVAPEYRNLSAVVAQQAKARIAREEAEKEKAQQQAAEQAEQPAADENAAPEAAQEEEAVQPIEAPVTPQQVEAAEEEPAASDEAVSDETQQLPESEAETQVLDADEAEEAPAAAEKKGKTKVCKKCGATISANEKVCPKCGEKQGGSGGLIAIIIIGAVIIVGAIGFLIYLVMGHSTSTSSTSQSATTPTTATSTTAAASTAASTTALVTNAMYEQVQNGMTYDQVVAIFGKEGTLLSESTYKDADGNDVQLKIYYWEGQGETGANASVSFQGDTVVTKSSYGLQ
jgi:ribosomal protein L40E